MPASAQELLGSEFETLSKLLQIHAIEQPRHAALVEGDRSVNYGELDILIDAVATALQARGLRKGDVVAICAANSIEYVTCFLGALRAGAVVAPLATSATSHSLGKQLGDSDARVLFLDARASALLPETSEQGIERVALDGSSSGLPLTDWIKRGTRPAPVSIGPDDPFNIIYSSGTTGAAKGIVQPHKMRWTQIRRVTFPATAVTLVSTPLYSNTTLVSLIPTLGVGGTAVVMPKFDAEQFLRLAEFHSVTHAMLVPVQYRRILDHPNFGATNLTSFQMKFCTSAPFLASLKAEVLARWPGGLVEYYGMTEGGCTCALFAHLHPGKLHTVGQPLPGHEIRFISDEGAELPAGEVGEIVGRSPGMMLEYRKQPELSAAAEWFSPEGFRFIRTGDVGQLDSDGFVVLLDRKKDMIISGGFNIYPSDLEGELMGHEAVGEAAVIGVASDVWGETPVGFVVLKAGFDTTVEAIKEWVNAKVGRTQRLADVRFVATLPRSSIGKVLKRELADLFAAEDHGGR